MRGGLQAAAFLKNRNELVELRARMRASQRDAYRMKQLLAFGSGFGLDLVHPCLEQFRSDCALACVNALRKGGENFLRRLQLQNGFVFGIRSRRSGIEAEDELRLLGQLFKAVDRRHKKRN